MILIQTAISSHYSPVVAGWTLVNYVVFLAQMSISSLEAQRFLLRFGLISAHFVVLTRVERSLS
jgi:hypothetical protein